MKRKIIFEMDIKEEWIKVKNYPAYKISNFGRVKRVEAGLGTYVGRILKLQVDTNGYLQIGLYKNKKAKRFYVHRLVAEAFIGPCPKGKEVNHIDGIKSNNEAWNLEYATRLENIKHAEKLGLRNIKGEKNPLNKLKKNDVKKIRRLYETGDYFQREIAKKFNVTIAAVSLVVNNKRWGHIN